MGQRYITKTESKPAGLRQNRGVYDTKGRNPSLIAVFWGSHGCDIALKFTELLNAGAFDEPTTTQENE